MSYSSIDPIINAWISQHSLTLYTKYQDSEVRSVDVVNKMGRKFQIWIDRPFTSFVKVHAWDYKKTRKEWEVESSQLGEALEQALSTVQSWGRADLKE